MAKEHPNIWKNIWMPFFFVSLFILLLHFFMDKEYFDGMLIASDGIFTMSPSGSLGAFHYSGENDRTYIGYYTSEAKVDIVFYDEEEKYLSNAVNLWSDWARGDDHSSPSVLVLLHQKGENSIHNEKILVASTAIYDDLPAQIRRSVNSEDISEWEDAYTFDIHVEYPTLIELSDGTIFLLYAKNSFPKDGERSQVYLISTDGGTTWSERQLLFDSDGTRRIYGIYYTNPDSTQIHGMFNLCPNSKEFGSWYKDIYYAYYDLDSDSWKKAVGEEYALPITPQSGDLVYKTDMTEGKEDHTWLSDIKVDENDSPYLVSINYKDYASNSHNPGNNPGWEGIVQRHNYIKGEWKTEIISEQGTGQFGSYSYPAMAVLDEDNVNIAYMTPYDRNKKTNLQKWEKSTDVWVKVEEITRNQSGYNFRPTYVRNAGRLKVLWCYTERYEHHRSGRWESKILGYPNLIDE
ncbi:MAG: BNR-4 repeat-containing protein [bacterium]